jgi:hypothetical protein
MKGPPGNGIAPPGSSRSGGGDNKAVGASGVEGRVRQLAESVGRNVSERRAGHETDNARSRPVRYVGNAEVELYYVSENRSSHHHGRDPSCHY